MTDTLYFGQRLALLREQAGVSARDMSLSIGQNAGYINSIENGKTFPSMTAFFYICEYLNITPAQFFDYDNNCPMELTQLNSSLKKLNKDQLTHITAIVNYLTEN